MIGPIVDPDGRTWTVRRQWVPRLGPETLWGRFHRRFRQTFRATGKVAESDWPDAFLEGLVIGVVLLLALLLGVPFLVALLDVALLLLLAGLALLARVLLRRPWIIQARAADGTVRSWRVTGWRASRDRRAEIEQRLRLGLDPLP
jgi:hypothetical protein